MWSIKVQFQHSLQDRTVVVGDEILIGRRTVAGE